MDAPSLDSACYPTLPHSRPDMTGETLARTPTSVVRASHPPRSDHVCSRSENDASRLRVSQTHTQIGTLASSHPTLSSQLEPSHISASAKVVSLFAHQKNGWVQGGISSPYKSKVAKKTHQPV